MLKNKKYQFYNHKMSVVKNLLYTGHRVFEVSRTLNSTLLDDRVFVWLLSLTFIAFISGICASVNSPTALRNIQTTTLSVWALCEDDDEAVFGVGMNNLLSYDLIYSEI